MLYLIHLIPCRVEVLLDDETLERNSPNIDLHKRVTLALHYAPQQVILGYQILRLLNVDLQHPLEGKK